MHGVWAGGRLKEARSIRAGLHGTPGAGRPGLAMQTRARGRGGGQLCCGANAAAQERHCSPQVNARSAPVRAPGRQLASSQCQAALDLLPLRAPGPSQLPLVLLTISAPLMSSAVHATPAAPQLAETRPLATKHAPARHLLAPAGKEGSTSHIRRDPLTYVSWNDMLTVAPGIQKGRSDMFPMGTTDALGLGRATGNMGGGSG